MTRVVLIEVYCEKNEIQDILTQRGGGLPPPQNKLETLWAIKSVVGIYFNLPTSIFFLLNFIGSASNIIMIVTKNQCDKPM